MEPKPGSVHSLSSSIASQTPPAHAAHRTEEAALEAAQDPIAKVVSVNNVGSIPNGGLAAWLQVLGSFLLFLNSWGVVNTFGVYQTFYESSLLSNEPPSTISWIGSMQGFLLMLVGALTGPIYDAGYFRALLLVGSFLVVFGHMMLSICSQYWQILLAQGLCMGLGFGCLFVPSVAILSTYFTTKVATAMGIAAAGSSIGGVVYPIALYQLIPKVGFPWAVRIIGFIVLGTLLLANIMMKVRVRPASRRMLVDWAAFREPPYTLFVIGGFIGFTGLYVPFFYIQIYAIAHHITNTHMAFYLLSILNASSTFGRLLPNYAADKIGPMNMIAPCALLSGVISLCLIPSSNMAALIVCCIMYGFFSGSFVSLPPSVLIHLCPNRGVIGTRMGMCFTICAVGILIGTPIGGAIEKGRGFTDAWIFGGIMTMVGGLILGAARVAKGGWKLKAWV